MRSWTPVARPWLKMCHRGTLAAMMNLITMLSIAILDESVNFIKRVRALDVLQRNIWKPMVVDSFGTTI